MTCTHSQPNLCFTFLCSPQTFRSDVCTDVDPLSVLLVIWCWCRCQSDVCTNADLKSVLPLIWNLCWRRSDVGADVNPYCCFLFSPLFLPFPFSPLVFFSGLLTSPQVRYKVRQAKAVLPPPPRRFPRRRISTRRSGYAFSHARGYGDLVTSGRFLRRQVKSRPALFPLAESPLAENSPQIYRNIGEGAQSS